MFSSSPPSNCVCWEVVELGSVARTVSTKGPVLTTKVHSLKFDLAEFKSTLLFRRHIIRAQIEAQCTKGMDLVLKLIIGEFWT